MPSLHVTNMILFGDKLTAVAYPFSLLREHHCLDIVFDFCLPQRLMPPFRDLMAELLEFTDRRREHLDTLEHEERFDFFPAISNHLWGFESLKIPTSFETIFFGETFCSRGLTYTQKWLANSHNCVQFGCGAMVRAILWREDKYCFCSPGEGCKAIDILPRRFDYRSTCECLDHYFPCQNAVLKMTICSRCTIGIPPLLIEIDSLHAAATYYRGTEPYVPCMFLKPRAEPRHSLAYFDEEDEDPNEDSVDMFSLLCADRSVSATFLSRPRPGRPQYVYTPRKRKSVGRRPHGGDPKACKKLHFSAEDV